MFGVGTVVSTESGGVRPEAVRVPTGLRLCGINQCVGCTRQFFTKSFLGDDAAVLAPSSDEEPTFATPSSRRRVDGVEDDAMIQHERAVKV